MSQCNSMSCVYYDGDWGCSIGCSPITDSQKDNRIADLERQLAEAREQIKAMRNCENCKHDRGGLLCKSKVKCYNKNADTVSLDAWDFNRKLLKGGGK